MIMISYEEEIIQELMRMWGQEWELTLEMVSNNNDAWDRYPRGYIERSNNLVMALNRKMVR